MPDRNEIAMLVTPATVRQFEDRQRALAERLKGSGGGGTSGGMSDDWKIDVDRQLGQLHSDVRNLLYGLIAGFVLLTGMIGGLYMHVDAKIDGLNAKFDAVSTRFDVINGRLGDLHAQQARIEGKLDLLVDRKQGRGARS